MYLFGLRKPTIFDQDLFGGLSVLPELPMAEIGKKWQEVHGQRLEPLFLRIEHLDKASKKQQITTFDMVEILSLWKQAIDEYLDSDNIELASFFIDYFEKKLSELGKNKIEGSNSIKRDAVYIGLLSMLELARASIVDIPLIEAKIVGFFRVISHSHPNMNVFVNSFRKNKLTELPHAGYESKTVDKFMSLISEDVEEFLEGLRGQLEDPSLDGHILRLFKYFPEEFLANLFNGSQDRILYLIELPEETLEFISGFAEVSPDDLVTNCITLSKLFSSEPVTISSVTQSAGLDIQGSVLLLELTNYWLRFNLDIEGDLSSDASLEGSLSLSDYMRIANTTFLISTLVDKAHVSGISKIRARQETILLDFADSSNYFSSSIRQTFRNIAVGFYNDFPWFSPSRTIFTGRLNTKFSANVHTPDEDNLGSATNQLG